MSTRVFCLVLSVLLAALSGPTLAGQEIRIASGEYVPWTSEKISNGGFVNHVIREAFSRVGHEVVFEYYPWKRAYNSAKTGDKFHATSYWAPSDERAKFYLYSDPMMNQIVVFFHLLDKAPSAWDSLADLKDKRIGATRGYTYSKAFWDAHKSKSIRVQVSDSDEMNFRKLLKGRIDLFLIGSVVAKKLLRDKFSAEEAARITFDPKPLIEATGHLLFNKERNDAEALRDDFNRGLAEIRADGTFAKFEAALIAGGYDK